MENVRSVGQKLMVWACKPTEELGAEASLWIYLKTSEGL